MYKRKKFSDLTDAEKEEELEKAFNCSGAFCLGDAESDGRKYKDCRKEDARLVYSRSLLKNYDELYTDVETIESFLKNHGEGMAERMQCATTRVRKLYFTDFDTITDDEVLELFGKYPDQYGVIKCVVTDHYDYMEKACSLPKSYEYIIRKEKEEREEEERRKKARLEKTAEINKEFLKAFNKFVKARKKIGNPVEFGSNPYSYSIGGMTVMRGDCDDWYCFKI